MEAIYLKNLTHVYPFERPASQLKVLNRTLEEHTSMLLRHSGIDKLKFINEYGELSRFCDDTVVLSDNLYFNRQLLGDFMKHSQSMGCPTQLAFKADDLSIREHAAWLQRGISLMKELYLAPMYYYPRGSELTNSPRPLIIDTDSHPVWYMALPNTDHWLRDGLFIDYQIPSAIDFAPLRLYVPRRAFVSIESWVQLLFANILWGIYGNALNLDFEIRRFPFRIRLWLSSLLQFKPPLRSSLLVQKSKSCRIDPTAAILGPTVIGNGTIIGPGASVVASVIGDNTYVGQNCGVYLSVIGDHCRLPASGSCFMSCLMDNVILVSPIRFSVVGEGTFIGAGVWTTDRILVEGEHPDQCLRGDMVRTTYRGKLEPTGYFILGSAIGNRVRIGTGHIIYPGRTISSDSILVARGTEQTSLIVARDV